MFGCYYDSKCICRLEAKIDCLHNILCALFEHMISQDTDAKAVEAIRQKLKISTDNLQKALDSVK